MAMFEPKPWVNSFGKMSIFRLFELVAFIAKKAIFAIKYWKRHFTGLYCLKKKSRKTANFWTKTMG